MHNATNETLTTEQMRFVDSLTVKQTLALLHYCADERLGGMNVKEYNETFNVPRRTIYDMIDNERVLSDQIFGVKFIVMNDK